MPTIFAICIYCKKSIIITDNSNSDSCVIKCPSCGQQLTIRELQRANAIIDTASAIREYNLAMDAFANNNFVDARRHFNSVLEYDCNNYLASYYSDICEIYECEMLSAFNLPLSAVNSIEVSIEKMDLSQVKINDRSVFLTMALSQIYILISNYFNKLSQTAETSKDWQVFRKEAVKIIEALRRFVNFDKESLMLYDNNIAKTVVNILDIGICACKKYAVPHYDNERLSFPDSVEFDKIKELYGLLSYYIYTIDPNYANSISTAYYTENLLLNDDAITAIHDYMVDNKKLLKQYFSPTDGTYVEVFNLCEKAIKLSQYNCSKSLIPLQNNVTIDGLASDAITMCLDILMPHFTVSTRFKNGVDISSFLEVSGYVTKLNIFLEILNKTHATLVQEKVSKFYTDLYNCIEYHFKPMQNILNKQMERIKKNPFSPEFKYYQSRFFDMVCYSALACNENIQYLYSKKFERLRLLKLGNQIADDYFTMFDYDADAIANDSAYRGIIHSFSLIEDNIEELS